MSFRKFLSLAMLVGLLPWAAGCGSSDGEFKNFEKKEAAADDHGHDHDHDHGDHHDEHGPHDGHLVEFGDHEFMGEVVFNAGEHVLGVYILDHDELKALPIDAKEIAAHLHMGEKEQEFKLAAKPQEGDAEGKSSYFELAGDATIKEHLTDAEDLEGEIMVTSGGKAYTGEIVHHHDHDHDGHDHGKKHDHDDHEDDHGEEGHKHDDDKKKEEKK